MKTKLLKKIRKYYYVKHFGDKSYLIIPVLKDVFYETNIFSNNFEHILREILIRVDESQYFKYIEKIRKRNDKMYYNKIVSL